MIETQLCAALADLFGAEYETPANPDERRAIAWTLHVITHDPELAELFDRQRLTQGGATA